MVLMRREGSKVFIFFSPVYHFLTFFLYFYLFISWSYRLFHPFSSSFSSLSSLFCSLHLPLFSTLSLRFIFVLSAFFSYFDVLYTPPELYLLPPSPIKNRHVVPYTVIFLLYVFRVENGGYYNKLELAYNCPVCQKLVCHRQTNSIFFTYHLRYPRQNSNTED